MIGEALADTTQRCRSGEKQEPVLGKRRELHLKRGVVVGADRIAAAVGHDERPDDRLRHAGEGGVRRLSFVDAAGAGHAGRLVHRNDVHRDGGGVRQIDRRQRGGPIVRQHGERVGRLLAAIVHVDQIAVDDVLLGEDRVHPKPGPAQREAAMDRAGREPIDDLARILAALGDLRIDGRKRRNRHHRAGAALDHIERAVGDQDRIVGRRHLDADVTLAVRIGPVGVVGDAERQRGGARKRPPFHVRGGERQLIQPGIGVGKRSREGKAPRYRRAEAAGVGERSNADIVDDGADCEGVAGQAAAEIPAGKGCRAGAGLVQRARLGNDDRIGRAGDRWRIQQMVPGRKRCDLERRIDVDGPGPGFKIPVSAEPCTARGIGGRGDIRAGQRGETVDQRLAAWKLRDIAPPDQDVAVGVQRGAPLRDLRGMCRQGAGVHVGGANPERSVLAVADKVDGGQIALMSGKGVGDLRQAVPGRVSTTT